MPTSRPGSVNQPRARLRDVAQLAGVSPTTASLVMAGRHEEGRIPLDTQERVRQAAAELGYRPNLAARSLRTRTSRIVGLVFDAITTEPHAVEIVRGALAAAAARDYLLVIAETDGDRHAEDELLRGMIDRQVDGLVYGTMFTHQVTLPPALAHYPVVLLNCLADPLPGPAVVPDEAAAGREAARGLLQAGHREGIYLVGRPSREVFAATERSRGIQTELTAIDARLAGRVDCEWDSPERAYPAVRRLLARARPAALICLNDRIAMGVYQALHDTGLRIPRDVSVVSFDDSPLASWLRPGLSSVALPHHEMGRLAVELLINGERDPMVRQVGIMFRQRESINHLVCAK